MYFCSLKSGILLDYNLVHFGITIYNNIGLSVDAVLNIAKTIPNVTVNLSGNAFTKTLFLTDRHKQIIPLFEDEFWVSQNYTENKEDT